MHLPNAYFAYVYTRVYPWGMHLEITYCFLTEVCTALIALYKLIIKPFPNSIHIDSGFITTLLCWIVMYPVCLLNHRLVNIELTGTSCDPCHIRRRGCSKFVIEEWNQSGHPAKFSIMFLYVMWFQLLMLVHLVCLMFFFSHLSPNRALVHANSYWRLVAGNLKNKHCKDLWST